MQRGRQQLTKNTRCKPGTTASARYFAAYSRSQKGRSSLILDVGIKTSRGAN